MPSYPVENTDLCPHKTMASLKTSLLRIGTALPDTGKYSTTNEKL